MDRKPITKEDAVRSFEDGTLSVCGAVRVVDLRGSWFEMGRQYGALISEQLSEIIDFVNGIRGASPENETSARDICCTQCKQMPYTVRRFIAGAAETSGHSFEELCYANAVEYIAGLPKCSAIAVWCDYAKDGLVFGRNYDYGEAFLELNRDVVVTVFHPADGSLASAIVGYAGEIYAVNGFNEKGIFLELNNGTPSTQDAMLGDRISGTTLLFKLLFEADSLDGMDLFFNTARCNDSYIINLADGARAVSYEWAHGGAKRIDETKPGLLIATNHYVHPDWPYDVPTDAISWQSITRRCNLLDLAEAGKGAFDAKSMAALLDRQIEDGGVTDNLTVYQLIVEPEKQLMHLKIAGSADWTGIDLKSFLKA